MIIMDIKADNLYALKNFHMNMSYPKKIVNSTIADEYLPDKPNFRYKKVNIIMGGNAAGKTSLGKLLILFTNYFSDGNYSRFLNIIDNRKNDASLSIDFVTDEDVLYRFHIHISAKNHGDYKDEDVYNTISYTEINKKDNYETCAKRLDAHSCSRTSYDKIDTRGWFFSYPQDAWKNKTYFSIENDDNYRRVSKKAIFC